MVGLITKAIEILNQHGVKTLKLLAKLINQIHKKSSKITN